MLAHPPDTDTILVGATQTLDFTRPVAVIRIAVLHFIWDTDITPEASAEGGLIGYVGVGKKP